MDIQLLVNVRLYRENFYMEKYISTNNIFALVKSGKFSVESEKGNYVIGKNEGVVFLKDVLYHRKVIEPVELYLFRYNTEKPVFADDRIVFKDVQRIQSTIDMLEKLDNGIFKDEFEHRRNLFLDIINQYSIENNDHVLESEKKEDQMEKAISLISEKIHKCFALSEIAESIGLSYIQFLRRFQSYTGMTPSDYVAIMRFQKAKSLLTETNLIVKDVAAACGFENEYYFSKFFKKKAGVSPSAFRNIMA